MKKINLMREQSSREENVMIEHDDVSKYESIEGTPFTGIKVKDKWIIVMGDEVASGKRFETLIELEQYVECKPWELIVTASNIFGRIVEKNKEKEVKDEQ